MIAVVTLRTTTVRAVVICARRMLCMTAVMAVVTLRTTTVRAVVICARIMLCMMITTLIEIMRLEIIVITGVVVVNITMIVTMNMMRGSGEGTLAEGSRHNKRL